jgi:hypothetical protein
VFKLPKFFSGCPPKNFTDASKRLYYVSYNFEKLPQGYMFGPLSFVFNRTYVDPTTFIAPVDSGTWMPCYGNPASNKTKMNCSGWYPPVLGSVPHLNHLFLATYWLQGGEYAFPRIDCVSGIGRPAPTEFPYFESNIIGSLSYASGAVLYLLVSW